MGERKWDGGGGGEQESKSLEMGQEECRGEFGRGRGWKGGGGGRSGNSSVVERRTRDRKVPRVRVPAGAAVEFSSPVSTLYFECCFGIRSTPMRPQ